MLTLSYLAGTGDQTFVVSAMVSNPSAEVPEIAPQELEALIRGAFTLAAGVPAPADIPFAGPTEVEATALRPLGLHRVQPRP